MASNITVDTLTKGAVTLNTDELVDVNNTRVCKAWVNFNGTGTVAIRASYNVSSITDRGTGRYTVNFTTSLTDINGSVVASVSSSGTEADKNRAACCSLLTSSTATVNCFACTNEVDTDVGFAQVTIFR